MNWPRSPVLRVFTSVVTVILLFTILGPFFQVIYGALFSQVSGFSVQAVYTVFLATPEYLMVFWRTLALCALIVVSQVALSVLAGLGFAKYTFPGKNLCFFLLLVVMVLPLQVTLVPNFRILGSLGLLDTQWALILPAVFAPLGTFLMTQSFRAVPDEILEAAHLDGASMGTVLWRILVPNSKNGLACVIVLTFLEAWNMVEQPIAYLKDMSQHPLSVALVTTQARDAGVQLACCLLALLPPLLLFLGFHKELIQGITLREDWANGSSHRGFFQVLTVALVVLAECTLLSGSISQEMTIQVETNSPLSDSTRGIDSLPLDAFHQEEDGTFLYLMEEGSGLLGGMRLRRVPADILSLEEDRAFTTGLQSGDSYVIYASRPLEDEALAEKVAPGEPTSDTYLLWAPEDMELSLDAPSVPVEGGQVWLLPQEEAAQPFLVQRELASLLPAEQRASCRLFSFHDVEQFARELPRVGLVVVLMVAPLVCCAGLCLSLGQQKRRVFKVLWAILTVGSLGSLMALLMGLDLPSSLLPPDILFDLGYFSRTLHLIGDSLAANPENSACVELQTLLSGQVQAMGLIIVGGLLTLAFLLACGIFLQRKRKQPPEGRHFK